MAKKHIPDKSHTAEKAAEPDFKVTLKPFLGMKPGLYLTVIYAIIILFIVYLVLFLPGIRKNGIYYRVFSSPNGAAVWVDDEYAGAAANEVFVPKGAHRIRVSKPYFNDEVKDIQVRGRIFGSLIAPKRRTLNFNLSIADAPGLLADSFTEASRWALIDKVFYNYQVPKLLKESAENLLSPSGRRSDAAALQGLLDEGRAWLQKLPLNVTNEYLLKDYIGAAAVISAEGGVLSPAQLLSLVRDAAAFLGSENASVFWLSRILPDSSKETLLKTEWFRKKSVEFANLINDAPVAVEEGKLDPVTIDGIRFAHIPGGRFIAGGSQTAYSGNALAGETDIPYPVSVKEFYIMDHAVSWKEFEIFLENSPEWRSSNSPVLNEQVKVTESYLQKEDMSSINESANQDTLYNVSWWAAKAYCAWLSTKLPQNLSGYEIRLPHEAEWEWAVKFLDNPNFSSGFWEWCGNWYFPEETIFPDLAGSTADDTRFAGAEAAVRGGSWANQPGSITPETRGSQPPEWCTPFLGFRAILAARQ